MRFLIYPIIWMLAITGLAAAEEKPNILWIFAEDTSPWMGCYGHEVNEGHTPHIDSLADQGVLFKRAYVPAPVCSACRSALMGGKNQIRFNAHELSWNGSALSAGGHETITSNHEREWLLDLQSGKNGLQFHLG